MTIQSIHKYELETDHKEKDKKMNESALLMSIKIQIIRALVEELKITEDVPIELKVFSSIHGKSDPEGLLGVSFLIKLRGGDLKGLVYLNEDAATSTYQEAVRQWILNGVFFLNVMVGIEVFREICKVANIAGLSKWLRVVNLSGCVSEIPQTGASLPVPLVITDENLIGQLRDKKISESEDLESNLFDQVLSFASTPVEGTKVLMDHCSFQNRELEAAIVRGCGGWTGLTEFGVTAKTPQGFLIEPSDDFTCEYMKALYK